MKWALAATVSLLCVCSAASGQETSYGQAEYLNSCAMCHGESGEGDGPLAHDLYKAPSDLTRLSERNAASFPTGWCSPPLTAGMRRTSGIIATCRYGANGFWKATPKKYGSKGGEAVTTERILQLADHVQSMQRH